jgi:hypothetical protein
VLVIPRLLYGHHPVLMDTMGVDTVLVAKVVQEEEEEV